MTLRHRLENLAERIRPRAGILLGEIIYGDAQTDEAARPVVRIGPQYGVVFILVGEDDSAKDTQRRIAREVRKLRAQQTAPLPTERSDDETSPA